MSDKINTLPPEPYFSGYLILLYRVLISLRLRTGYPEKMSQEELVTLIKDIHELSDALHNVPQFLSGTNEWFTPQRMEELYIAGYDERQGELNGSGFSLREMLKSCIKEAEAKNKNKMLYVERGEPYYPRDDQPLIAFTLSHPEMVERFGPAHRQMDAQDDEPGPCEYWSFRFPCGLITFIAYHFHVPTGAGGTVYATSPDIAHIIKHLPIVDCLFWRLDYAEPEIYQQRYGNVSDTCSLLACPDPVEGSPFKSPSRKKWWELWK